MVTISASIEPAVMAKAWAWIMGVTATATEEITYGGVERVAFGLHIRDR